jgi:hypothetical protein
MKGLLLKRRVVVRHKPPKVGKNSRYPHDLFEYSANTIMATTKKNHVDLSVGFRAIWLRGK